MDDYLDSPLETEDVFPCKGCGEILEEGKAFELAGNRWHLNCFRCNTCGTLLDSDANLLLLGDGSLICNNCTYSCSACGNKIEDLAILTGDQAFCATCFRCRNCKRKIENLRYARTSQGIFCMSCHESLMARRRKKSKAAAQAKAREKEQSPMLMDKSLPALPPNAIPPNAFSNDRVDPESDTPTELSPRPTTRPGYGRNDSSSRSSSRPGRSPERSIDAVAKDNGLAIPPRNRGNRNSSVFTGVDTSGNNAGGETDGFFISVALDPSPAPSATPKSTTDPQQKTKDKDYFSLNKQPPQNERKTDSQTSTPHIAFQEKGRQTSSDYELPQSKVSRKLSKSSRAERSSQPKHADDPVQRTTSGKSQPREEFKLQDAPKSKKSNSRTNSQSNVLQENGNPRSSSVTLQKDKERLVNGPTTESPQLLQSAEKFGDPRSSQDSRFKEEEEGRSSADLLSSSVNGSKTIARKEVPTGTSKNVNGQTPSGSVSRSGTNDELLGLNDPSRPALGEQKLSDTYMTPRAPPRPPAPSHTSKDSTSSAGGYSQNHQSPRMPGLPAWTSVGDFSQDAAFSRILGTHDTDAINVMRSTSERAQHSRTSSATSGRTPARISHSRSVSETTRSPGWPTTPIAEHPLNGDAQVASPMSIVGHEDAAVLKRRLRTSEQRIAELERQFHSEKDLQNLNEKLQEKRKTVSVLDSQTEIMIQQLEVLAGYVERAKDTKQPIDARELEDSAIKTFVQKLDKVKQTMATSLEQLHAERDEIIDEKNQAVADRDKALLEFAQLSAKNAQLVDMNNDLTQTLQQRLKNHSDLKSPLNGLGIYNQSQHAKGSSNLSITNLDATSIQTGTTIVDRDTDEPIIAEAGPQVVKIGKGQVRKFNWKKGSKTMAQNIAKGVNRAAVAFQEGREGRRDMQPPSLAGHDIGMPYNMTVAPVESPASHGPNGYPNKQALDSGRQGFFGFKKTNTMPQKSASGANVSTPTIAEAPTTLFGSELSERADYERRQIPSVVTRCIEEVELRGMDMEGIYRKTGGNSQVKMIQDGFDKNDGFDISDPDMDITAVTSVLKQYFRKLPTPLLTYDVYDRILETNTINNEEEKIVHLRKAFNALPGAHKDCLEFLMFHLVRVAQREKENLMSPKNLAVVFAPTIMRDTNIEREMTDMHAKNLAVQFIIENSQDIFSE